VWPAQAKLPAAAPAKFVICDETIETINDELKNVCQIERTRHRSPTNFLMCLLVSLIAYCHQSKKLSLWASTFSGSSRRSLSRTDVIPGCRQELTDFARLYAAKMGFPDER